MFFKRIKTHRFERLKATAHTSNERKGPSGASLSVMLGHGLGPRQKLGKSSTISSAQLGVKKLSPHDLADMKRNRVFLE